MTLVIVDYEVSGKQYSLDVSVIYNRRRYFSSLFNIRPNLQEAKSGRISHFKKKVQL